jgi:transposase-like protein
LKKRGLKGVRLFVSDKCLGLVEALGGCFPEAAWQRCMVHFYRDAMHAAPHERMQEVMPALRAIHAPEDRAAAREKARSVASKLLEKKLPKAAKIILEGVEETLSHYAFPRERWRSLRTDNSLERPNREIRRRTRVAGAFPDGQSALMPVSARLRHMAGTKWGLCRYLNMKHLSSREAEQREERLAPISSAVV